MAYAADGSTLYASAPGAGVIKSTNGGASWASASSGLALGTSRMRLALAPSNAQTLYALPDSGGLYRSTNGGASWSLRKSGACEGQCSYNLALAVHPTNADKLLVGSIRFALSTDGGATLSYLTNGWGSSQQVHQDTHTLTWSKTNPNRFWVGSDGGIWRSDNSGSSFANMNSNLNVTQFYDIAVDTTDSNRMFGGAQDNSSSGRAVSKVWGLTYASGDGFMNVVDASNPSTVLQTSYPGGSYPSIVRSTTGGAAGSFGSLPNTGLTASGNFPWVTPLAGAGALVWVASDQVYVGTTSAASFRWYGLSGSLGSAASVLSPIQSGGAYQLYVGTSGGKIFRSTSATATGGSLSEVTGNYPGGRVSDIAVDPSNTQRVFATRGVFSGGHLYRSTSGGTSWTAVGSGLPNVPANSVAIDPLDGQRVFVGTDIGVYESADGGASFQPFSAGLPLGLVVSDLEIDDAPHVLVAGSYGRGAWKVALQGGGTLNQPPVSAFAYSKNQLTVSFTDQSTDADGSIVSRAWNFGDGTTSTAANPSKTYAAAGTYTVALTVTDDDGATHASSQSVVVSTSACAGTTLSGSFSGGTGQTQYQPNGSYYQSTSSGTHGACLTGPGSADYDLYLDKWDGAKWVQVAKSDGPTAAETLSYNGAAGYYMYRVVNYSGTGAYSFTYNRPN
ncbi:MAG: PKD domain-containing protein [Gammaproteobacteria bacterium]|nr:PKD domain-containing protein [Gammaproteobacteria bacterium]